jgi:riboflavin kinase/FMN adenylyltransferase
MLEVHIFDFDRDIYDTEITIEILLTIRDNQKFNSLDELKKQIEKDKKTMEEWLESNKRL